MTMSTAWGKTVDAFAQGKLRRDQLARVMKTPLVFTFVGAVLDGGNMRDIVIRYNTLKNSLRPKGSRGAVEHTEGHGLTLDQVKQIPAAMADPIMLFQTDDEKVVAVLELKDNDGSTIITPLLFEREEHGIEIVNELITAYGRDKGIAGSPVQEWFSENAFNNLLYINTEKASFWAFNENAYSLNVSTFERLGKIVPNETDLDNLRNEYPRLFQSGNGGEGPVRGFVDLPSDGQGGVRITFTPDADVTTGLHELGHVFLWLTDLQARRFQGGAENFQPLLSDAASMELYSESIIAVM